jgi:hypothetical protein
VTEDEKLELWRTSAVRGAGWVPVVARRVVDRPGAVHDAVQGAIVVAAAADILGLEYRWPVDSSGKLAADFQSACVP